MAFQQPSPPPLLVGSRRRGGPAKPVYYPACTTNLTIRFDEALQLDGSSLPDPQNADDVSGAGQLNPDALSQAWASAQLGIPGLPSGGLIQHTGSDNLSQILNVIPRQATVELPGYRQAGTFSLELAWRDLPIDPRAIRALEVEIHIGTIDPGTWGSGQTQSAGVLGPRPSFLVTRNDQGLPVDDNLVLIGIVDSIKTKYTGKSQITILEGRDPRGILLTTYIQPDTLNSLDLTLPIDQFVQAVCNCHPRQEVDPTTGRPTAFFVQPADPSEWPKRQVPSPNGLGKVNRYRLGAQGNRPQPSSMVDPNKTSFWDTITYYCQLVGAIPYFSGRNILVRPSLSIFDLTNLNNQNTKSPFAGGRSRTELTTSGSQTTWKWRRLVYGRDIENLELERKIGGVQTPLVHVVSFNPASTAKGIGKRLEAFYPTQVSVSPTTATTASAAGSKQTTSTQAAAAQGKVKTAKNLTAALRTAMSASGKTSEQEALYISVPGIKDLEQLQSIAQGLYEEIGRQELGGSCTTKELASYGGDNSDPDMVRMRPGDAVEILVDQRPLDSTNPLVGTTVDFARASFAEAVKAVKTRLGTSDDNLARVIVASAQGLVSQFTTFFRVKNIKMTWTRQGLSTDFDFHNYIQIRSQMAQAPAPGGNG